MGEHRTVIVGGGFGGVTAARALQDAPTQVTLIDRRNHHLFQPLLYQVATGDLSPADIAAPLRSLFSHQRNVDVLYGSVTGFDVEKKCVLLADGAVPYDSLIVAAGARHGYFGHDEWSRNAPGLKTVEDALDIRKRIYFAFEAADRCRDDPEARREWLTFVIVGAGPTGVEMAGALSEIARHGLASEFRHIDPSEATIVLVDAADRVLPPFRPQLSDAAARSLRRMGVMLSVASIVTDISPTCVTLKEGDETRQIATRTIIWAAGVQASPLGPALADATGCETDRSGRVVVDADCSLKGHPDLFVIGDLAHHAHGSDQPLPGLAPVANQQGEYVGKLISARLRGETLPPFMYHDRGTMAVVGRGFAVAQLSRLSFSGWLAWVFWGLVHLMMISRMQMRLLVLFQWLWSYVTHRKSARLITNAADSRIVMSREDR